MKYWKSIIALAVMPFAFYFNLVNFYFAIVFLIWSIQGIRTRTTNLLDQIHQNENPILFWIITITWILLAMLSLAYSEPIMNWYYGI